MGDEILRKLSFHMIPVSRGEVTQRLPHFYVLV